MFRRLRRIPWIMRGSFVFHCYRAPRDLPSFPTRRSSDLFDVLVEQNRQQEAEDETGEDEEEREDDGVTQIDLEAEDPEQLDRKSTRLNSSHPSISYAVFCLKKKNGGRAHHRTPLNAPTSA